MRGPDRSEIAVGAFVGECACAGVCVLARTFFTLSVQRERGLFSTYPGLVSNSLRFLCALIVLPLCAVVCVLCADLCAVCVRSVCGLCAVCVRFVCGLCAVCVRPVRGEVWSPALAAVPAALLAGILAVLLAVLLAAVAPPFGQAAFQN